MRCILQLTPLDKVNYEKCNFYNLVRDKYSTNISKTLNSDKYVYFAISLHAADSSIDSHIYMIHKRIMKKIHTISYYNQYMEENGKPSYDYVSDTIKVGIGNTDYDLPAYLGIIEFH